MKIKDKLKPIDKLVLLEYAKEQGQKRGDIANETWEQFEVRVVDAFHRRRKKCAVWRRDHKP